MQGLQALLTSSWRVCTPSGASFHAGLATADYDHTTWIMGFKDGQRIVPSTPMIPMITSTVALIILNVVHCLWFEAWASESNDMKFAGSVWLSYLILQIVALIYSYVACKWLFPKFHLGFLGIPFFIWGFLPAFAIIAVPYIFTVQSHRAKQAPRTAREVPRQQHMQMQQHFHGDMLAHKMMTQNNALSVTPEPPTLLSHAVPVLPRFSPRKLGGR